MNAMMDTAMDTELAVLSVSTDSWEQRLLMSEWLGRKIIDMGTASGLKHWLCQLIEGLKYTICDWI